MTEMAKKRSSKAGTGTAPASAPPTPEELAKQLDEVEQMFCATLRPAQLTIPLKGFFTGNVPIKGSFFGPLSATVSGEFKQYVWLLDVAQVAIVPELEGKVEIVRDKTITTEVDDGTQEDTKTAVYKGKIGDMTLTIQILPIDPADFPALENKYRVDVREATDKEMATSMREKGQKSLDDFGDGGVEDTVEGEPAGEDGQGDDDGSGDAGPNA